MPVDIYNKSEIDALVSGINTSIMGINTSIGTINTSIVGAQTAITNTNTSLANLTGIVTNTNTSLTNLTNIVNDLKTRVAKLETTTPPPPPPSNILLEDTFSTTYNLLDGQTSPDGKWRMKYVSGGRVFSDGQVLTMYPRTVTSIDQTASTLLLSVGKFKDFQWDIDMKVNKQLRTGSPPKAWETAWIFWSYNDEAEGPLKRSNHHYYFLLKTNGYEWGKKDNAPGDVTNEKQIFIKTGTTPFAKVGITNHVTVIKKGFHFTIKVDGTTVVDMDDPQVNDPVKMAEGLLGLYEEDSNVSFDNVKVVTAP